MGQNTNRVAVLLAAIVALLMAPSGVADAAPQHGTRAAAVRSICETGYRGMPAYNRLCLKRGTVLDGVNLWFRDVDTHKVIPASQRRAFCKDATATGHTRAGIIDGLNDIAYDRYTNYRFVLSVAGTVGVLDCQQLGVKIKK
jgi:hypothetical protein